MAGGKLEVQIGADKTDFDKKIKEVEFDIKELSKVKLDRLKLGLDTTEINAQIKDAKNNLNQLKTTVKDTGATIGGQFKQQTANGSNALLQFSRIAQDAPFGIIGIGNNLTATAEAFSALKNQTGSTGGALKALGASLAGSGGILLGVSLLTTGFTLLSQRGLSVNDVFNKLTGNFDEFASSLSKANQEAVKNSASEISGLNALVSASQNVSLSIKDRLIAVNELQKTYPGYFGNLTKEQILNGDVKTAVEGVTQALIAKAKAQAFTKELIKLSEEQFKLEEENLKLLQQKQQAEAKQAQAVKNVIKVNKSRGDAEAFTAVQTIANTEEINRKLADNEAQLKKNAEAQAKWTSRINENVAASIRLNQTASGQTKTFNTPQVSAIGQAIIPAPTFDTLGIATFNGQVDQFGNKIKELPNTIKASMGLAREAMGVEMAAFNAMWVDFGLKFSEILETGIEASLISFGETLGNALINGVSVLEAIGASLLDSIGNTIKAVGIELVKMGVLAQAYAAVVQWMKKAFANPYALAAAGVALVAIGAAISASAKRVGNGGGGGSASSNTGSGANNTSFTSGSFSARGDGGGTVVFEIAGQKLIGVLSNTLNANRRLGGSLQLG